MVAALCVVSFLATLMYSSLSPFFTEIGEDLNVSVPALGQVVTARVLLSAALAILAGPLADRFGYRRLILIGLGALALTFLGVSVSPSYLMLFLTSIPGGIAGATLSGLPLALAGSSFTGEARKQAISYTVAALSSSAIVGLPLLTFASRFLGWRGVFLATALVSLGAMALVWRALPAHSRIHDGSRFRLSTITGPYRTLLGDSAMVRLFASTFLRATGWIGFLTYAGAYLADDVGLSVTAVGLAYMVGGGAYFLGSLAAGRFAIPWTPAIFASVMTIASSVTLIVVTLATSLPVVVVLGIALTGLASALAWVMFTTLMATMTRAGQGTTMSFNATIQNLGAAAGGIVGGMAIAISGYQLLGATLGIALALSGLLILVTVRSMGPAEPSAPPESTR
jgi:predicted MFS family arabinose efflux permease